MNSHQNNNTDHFAPSWIIKSKLYPARQAIDTINRSILINKINSNIDLPLSLLCAPGGYGKSTLLTQWYHQLLEEGEKACWLSIDPDDNDPIQFLAYVIFSLLEGGVCFEEIESNKNVSINDMSIRQLLSTINRAIESDKKKIVLIIDDFDHIAKETIEAALLPILNYAPKNLHISISCRDDQDIHITGLEVMGLVARINSEDLCFTFQEVETIFTAFSSKKTTKEIYKLTEGWPVAIQILKNSLKNTAPSEEPLANFDSKSKLLTHYLSEQIFDLLSDDLKQFLMEVSISDRISCEFSDHIRQRDDSALLFNRCNTLGSLILPIENLDKTFRIHPILREFLYEKLKETQPSHAMELHKLAAEWFSNSADIIKSIDHCVKANHEEFATEVIKRSGGIHIWLKEGLRRLRIALSMLSEEAIYGSPQLTIIQCLIHIKDGHLHKARMEFDLLNEKTNGQQQPNETVDREKVLLEILLLIYEGKAPSDSLTINLEEISSKTDPSDHLIQGYIYNSFCAVYSQKGLFNKSEEYAQKALVELKKSHSIYGEIYISFHLGGFEFAKGNNEKSEAHYQHGLRLIHQYFNDEKRLKLMANTFISEKKFERDEFISFNFVNANLKHIRDGEAWFDIYSSAYITASNFEFNHHGFSEALSVLNKAYDYANSQNLEHLNRLTTIQHVNLLLKSNNLKDAQEILSNSGISIEEYQNTESQSWPWRETFVASTTLIRLMIYEGKLEEALNHIEYFESSELTKENTPLKIRYKILKSITVKELGNTKLSYDLIVDALKLAEKPGYIRPFLDEKPVITDLLESALENDSSLSKNLCDFSEKITQTDAASSETTETSSALSKRELQVLEQLCYGHSNKVIARNIDVSENTVRFHLKNIFTKLNVDNRTRAASIAKKNGLIK